MNERNAVVDHVARRREEKSFINYEGKCINQRCKYPVRRGTPAEIKLGAIHTFSCRLEGERERDRPSTILKDRGRDRYLVRYN